MLKTIQSLLATEELVQQTETLKALMVKILLLAQLSLPEAEEGVPLEPTKEMGKMVVLVEDPWAGALTQDPEQLVKETTVDKEQTVPQVLPEAAVVALVKWGVVQTLMQVDSAATAQLHQYPVSQLLAPEAVGVVLQMQTPQTWEAMAEGEPEEGLIP
jgi:hypothetical protein